MPSIIHGDCSSVYTSHAYGDFLQEHQIEDSMSAPGTPVDNAVIDSFQRSIKRELIYFNRRKTKGEMKALIDNYTNIYYIHNRIHSKFMMKPYQYQQQLF